MNQDLIQLIKLYTTKDHKELSGFLLDKSKDGLIAIVNDLLTIYINDKNSSTIREFITVELAGYNILPKKLVTMVIKLQAILEINQSLAKLNQRILQLKNIILLKTKREKLLQPN